MDDIQRLRYLSKEDGDDAVDPVEVFVTCPSVKYAGICFCACQHYEQCKRFFDDPMFKMIEEAHRYEEDR